MARIDTLTNFLTDVAGAIKEKKGDSTAIPAEDFDTEIANLPSGGGNNFKDKVTGTARLTSAIIEAPQIDTSNCTNMASFFSNCDSLTTVPVLDVSKTEYTSNMFNQCTSLITIPQFGEFTNAMYISSMFYNCNKLENLPVLSFPKAQSIGDMFYNCTSLTDESMNNILATCITMKSSRLYASSKKLSTIGFDRMKTIYPVSRWEALSNYQAFIEAGWSIGYE